MTQNEVVTGILLDESSITLEELAHACAVEPQWIVERIEAGLFGDGSIQVKNMCFTSIDLTRAQRMRQLERDFDAVPELAALVADLLEEMDRLKERMKAAGLAVD